MKYFLSFFLLLFISHNLFAQFPSPSKGGGGFNPNQFNVGHFYGRILEEKTGKGIEFATIQLFQNRIDSVSKNMKRTLVTGALTAANGDFSMENLAVIGEYEMVITAIGFDSAMRKISFDINMSAIQQGNWQKALGGVDKDLGNIKLKTFATELGEVVVTAEDPIYKLELDKKVYSVDKDPSNAGGTAEDVLKKVPSVNVDLDGNVTLRNASPTIFVDGRPTTLTIDQIPSDAIYKIEVITNPSAKYDASGGQSGIINIVMKKNRRFGYNGNLRAGIDKRGKLNFGGDINVRQGKVNVFGMANFAQRKSISYNSTDRYNLYGEPLTNIFQVDTLTTNGHFGFGSLGFDYLLNNRNTFTLSGTYVNGKFNSLDDIYLTTDTLLDAGTVSSYAIRASNNDRSFNNLGSALQFKHLFPKDGHDLTADINFNQSTFSNNGVYTTQYYDENYFPLGNEELQKQNGSGTNRFITLQSDYKNPISDKMKIEGGVRAALRHFESVNNVYVFEDTVNDYVEVPDLNNYTYNDQVYAAYSTFTNEIKKFKYQIGLRAESSFYQGKLTDIDSTFNVNYPISLFPTVFVTYPLTDKSDLELNYTRKIDRPSFFQLNPFTDYSDSLNLSRGNPNLKPQFTNTIEFSYAKNFNRNNNFLASAYYKNTNDLITRYQELVYDTVLESDVIINTYVNANSSYLYGLEFTSTNTIKKKLTLSTNVNFYYSYINGSNIEAGLTNSQFSWFGKMNITYKLLKNLTVQLSADYQSKTSLPQGSGGGGGGRGYG
ncbi:MAG: TonB-dependent receptor, partial [Chitinophagales bacterium]|nr:TonB-dependent receptor [Chitinophagales bacterium]